MVVRTAAGAVPTRPAAEVTGESARALSAAAACAEASRDVWAPGAETPGEVSGKNPRPCLPATGCVPLGVLLTERVYPRGHARIPASPCEVTRSAGHQRPA